MSKIRYKTLKERKERVLHFVSKYLEEHGHYPFQRIVAEELKMSRPRVSQVMNELINDNRVTLCNICHQEHSKDPIYAYKNKTND